MRTVLSMNGGINRDVNPLYLNSAKGEVYERKNCRISSSEGSRFGINVSIKGMQEVTASLPSGTNQIIGYVEDKERQQGIFFNYNSNGDDGIYVFTGSLVRNLGVPSGVLNFDWLYPVQAAILGDYCVFTDNVNPPRKFKLINDNGVTAYNLLSTATAFTIQLAALPPSDKPDIVIGSDSSRVVNKLIGKTFQFAYMYLYNDYTYSVLSPYSDLAVSTSVFSTSDNTYTDNATGNYVQVSYDLGGTNVRAVKLVAREGNDGDWFVVEEYATGGSGGTRYYNFYNDVARKGLVETEAINLYSDVPIAAKSVLAVQNRIALGNVVKGYDKTSPSVQYDVEYEAVVVAGTSDSLSTTDGVADDYYYIDFTVPSDVAENEVIVVNIFSTYQELNGSTSEVYFDWRYSFSYTVKSTDTQSDVVDAIAYDFATTPKADIIFQVFDGDLSFWNIDAENHGSGVVRLFFIGVHDAARSTAYGSVGGSIAREIAPSGVSTAKSGSYYNVGVLFYDNYGRTSGVLNKQKVYIPHAGERIYADAFKKAKISFNIPDPTLGVPDWAVYYRFAITPSVNFAGVYPFVAGNDTATNIYDDVYIDGKKVIAINLPTNMQYEFAKGDYLQVEVDSGSAITTIQKVIIGTKTVIDVGSDVSGFWLIVPQGDESSTDFDGKLASIYRSKDIVSDLVYYEDDNTYDIVSGEMQTTSGYLGSPDAWFVSREFQWDGGTVVTQTIEDFYINIDSATRAYNRGRAVAEIDSLGQIRLQDFVWSFNYLDNTKINGISTFSYLNRVHLDEKDGEITGLGLSGYVAKVFQNNKETSIYIGKTEYTDAEGNLQVINSNDFVGTVRASTEEYGTRYPQSISQDGRNYFYWDGDRGQVIRSAPNGQYPISDYGMSSEFSRIKRDIDSALGVDSRSVRVISTFDVRNKEFVITFDIRGTAETWIFKEGENGWTQEIEYTNASGQAPDLYGRIGELSLGFHDNSVWKFEQTSSYNKFFGSFKTSSVTGVLNVYPKEEKCLKALETDSNRACDTTITSPVTNTRTVGQKSVLYAETYRSVNGKFTSPVFKNILQVGGATNLNLLHTGDDMVGQYLMLKFEDDGTTEFQLRNVTANFSVNK